MLAGPAPLLALSATSGRGGGSSSDTARVIGIVFALGTAVGAVAVFLAARPRCPPAGGVEETGWAA